MGTPDLVFVGLAGVPEAWREIRWCRYGGKLHTKGLVQWQNKKHSGDKIRDYCTSKRVVPASRRDGRKAKVDEAHVV